jgi:hypothetical protein
MRKNWRQLDTCKYFVETADGEPGFLNTIIGDGSWHFQYDPETKKQSAEW